jgi:hypothetical protein
MLEEYNIVFAAFFCVHLFFLGGGKGYFILTFLCLLKNSFVHWIWSLGNFVCLIG